MQNLEDFKEKRRQENRNTRQGEKKRGEEGKGEVEKWKYFPPLPSLLLTRKVRV